MSGFMALNRFVLCKKRKFYYKTRGTSICSFYLIDILNIFNNKQSEKIYDKIIGSKLC